MTALALETVVVVSDTTDPLYAEVGVIRNDWLKTFAPDKIVYSVEFSLGFGEYEADQLRPLVCECGADLETPHASCAACGLPLNKILERTLA
jgi:hypothetical protein